MDVCPDHFPLTHLPQQAPRTPNFIPCQDYMFLAGLPSLSVAAVELNHDIISLKVKKKKLGSYFLRPET